MKYNILNIVFYCNKDFFYSLRCFIKQQNVLLNLSRMVIIKKITASVGGGWRNTETPTHCKGIRKMGKSGKVLKRLNT